jgi:hypothetical protein
LRVRGRVIHELRFDSFLCVGSRCSRPGVGLDPGAALGGWRWVEEVVVRFWLHLLNRSRVPVVSHGVGEVRPFCHGMVRFMTTVRY